MANKKDKVAQDAKAAETAAKQVEKATKKSK